jgi:serine/threonine protein kinase
LTLDFLHSKGFSHRLICPSNIEFGIPPKQDYDVRLRNLSKAAHISDDVMEEAYGVPGYMAPEVFHGNSFYNSDLYSVGAILYKMISGKDLIQLDDHESLFEAN